MDKTVLIIGAIILAIVIVVGLVFLFIVKNRNKPTHTCKNGPYIKQSLVSDTFSKRESGHFIDVNPS